MLVFPARTWAVTREDATEAFALMLSARGLIPLRDISPFLCDVQPRRDTWWWEIYCACEVGNGLSKISR